MKAVENACALSEYDSVTANLEIVKLLIQNGANVNLKTSEGYTALDKAAS
jgi:ankyrin repeat protein